MLQLQRSRDRRKKSRVQFVETGFRGNTKNDVGIREITSEDFKTGGQQFKSTTENVMGTRRMRTSKSKSRLTFLRCGRPLEKKATSVNCFYP